MPISAAANRMICWRRLSVIIKPIVLVTLFIVTFVPVCDGQTTGCRQNRNYPVEVAFVIDASDKVDEFGNESWPNIVTFVQNVMRSSVGSSSNRVAYVTYADHPTVYAYLDTWSTSQDVNSIATHMAQIDLTGGQSADLAAALDIVRIQVLGRPSVRYNAWKAAFIVTDHLPSLSTSPQLRAAVVNARSEGIRLMVVAINVTAGAVDFNTLRFIGQNGLNSFSTSVNNYSSLNTPSAGFANNVAGWIGFCGLPLYYGCQAQLQDLVFVLDTSAIKPSLSVWNSELDFINTVISGFDYFGPSSVRVALVRYDDQIPSTQIELDWLNYYTVDKTQLSQAVSNIGLSKSNTSNLAKALRHLSNSFDLSISSERWKVAVVITDNLPPTVNSTELLAQADNTKADGWQIISVGINYNGQVNIDLLKKISGPRDGKMVHASDYGKLQSVVPAAVQLACFLGNYEPMPIASTTPTPTPVNPGYSNDSWKPVVIGIGVVACLGVLLHVVGLIICFQLFAYVRKTSSETAESTGSTVKTRQVIVNQSKHNSLKPHDDDYYGEIDAPPKEQPDYTPLDHES